MLTKPSFFPQALFSHPFLTINFSNPRNKARHDRMVALVTQMLNLNKKLPGDIMVPGNLCKQLLHN